MNQTKLKIWIDACRPKTLTAAIAPVMIGSSMALSVNSFHLLSALVALIGSILIQIGTNFANDYYDFKKGADTEERLGPTRATQAGLIEPPIMKRAFIYTFLLAGLLGLYLVYRGGWLILIFGILSILSGFLYTGGPKPLGYLGLGDVFVLFFFGVVAVSGTYYVQVRELNIEVILAGLSPGLIAMAILAVNNLRDISTDKKAGKKTLAVRFGANFVKLEFVMSILLANFITIYLVYRTQAHWYSLAACISILFSFPLMRKVMTLHGSELNPVLGNTGKILLMFSILFSLGWITS